MFEFVGLQELRHEQTHTMLKGIIKIAVEELRLIGVRKQGYAYKLK